MQKNDSENPVDQQEEVQLDGKGISIQMIIPAKEIKKGKANIE
jgi:hypothetical protein